MRAIAIICFMLSGFFIALGINGLTDVFDAVAEEPSAAGRFATLIGGGIGSFLFPLTFFLLGIGSLSSNSKKADVSRSC